MSWRGRVTAVSEDLDRPFWVKVWCAEIGGEAPDFIPPRPGPVVVMPAVGRFVEVDEVPGQSRRWWWSGPVWTRDDLPAAVRDLYPGVAALVAAGGAVVVVTDDGTVLVEGAVIRLGAAAGQKVALADEVKDRLDKLQQAVDTHVHATAAPGPPVPPTPVPGVIPVGPLLPVGASKVEAE